MKVQFGKDLKGQSMYKKNDPRVIGHDCCVQAVRLEMGKPHHKVFWGDRPQIVHLPVKVEGPPVSSSSLLRVGEIDGHTQFLTVITYVYKVAVTKITREKATKVVICDPLSSESEGEGVDKNNNDEEVPINVNFDEQNDGFSMISPHSS